MIELKAPKLQHQMEHVNAFFPVSCNATDLNNKIAFIYHVKNKSILKILKVNRKNRIHLTSLSLMNTFFIIFAIHFRTVEEENQINRPQNERKNMPLKNNMCLQQSYCFLYCYTTYFRLRPHKYKLVYFFSVSKSKIRIKKKSTKQKQI